MVRMLGVSGAAQVSLEQVTGRTVDDEVRELEPGAL